MINMWGPFSLTRLKKIQAKKKRQKEKDELEKKKKGALTSSGEGQESCISQASFWTHCSSSLMYSRPQTFIWNLDCPNRPFALTLYYWIKMGGSTVSVDMK